MNQFIQYFYNVGFFGFNQNGWIFKTPFIPSGSFLSKTNVDKVNWNYVISRYSNINNYKKKN